MFDLPETTIVAVGLATKPYPPFRLPGHNRFSVAYHSNGEKSHNYPFTSTPFGPLLKEGDVLGVGYRPRTGTVFFTRNGRKTEDAFIGLSRWNLFPTIGADGPCSVHVNLGQAGFVFIEANVKKWGLAPSVGTLAPPPAYGSERGSILLDVGGRIRNGTPQSASSTSSPSSQHRQRSRRHRPGTSSPLRTSVLAESPITPPPPITPIDEAVGDEDNSPSDDASAPLLRRALDNSVGSRSPSPSARPFDAGARNPFTNHRHHPSPLTHFANSLSVPRSELTVHPPPDSPMSPNANPPTPGQLDIHLQALAPGHRRLGSTGSTHQNSDTERIPNRPLTRKDPPAYSPLDAYTYVDGVHIDLPAEVIAAALEGGSIPPSTVGQSNAAQPSERRRSRRR